MRILHTSDWHIGKKLETKPRIDEQKIVLKNIAEIVREKMVDIVLIAGDIYDTYMPSAESEKLFYDTISDITKSGAQVIIISGNHDDPVRLTASKAMSSLSGVYFAGSGLENNFDLSQSTFKTRLIDYSDDYFVFEKEENNVSTKEDQFIFEYHPEKVYFAALPYPTEARMKEYHQDEESYEEKVTRYIKAATKNANDIPVVLIAHIFMLGGQATEGERPIDLGGARILPPSIIPENCIYTALGHLHKRQVVSSERNIIYSGSIMPYSFDEVGLSKSVTIFDIKNGEVQNLETINLSGFKELFSVSANSIAEAEEKVGDKNGFVEVKLQLDSPQSEAIKDFLKKYPNVFLRLTFKSGLAPVFGRKNLNDLELFKQYYATTFGSEPKNEICQLYLDFINEIEVGNET